MFGSMAHRCSLTARRRGNAGQHAASNESPNNREQASGVVVGGGGCMRGMRAELQN